MSRLNELIQEQCPDGVEFKKLGVICEIKTGKGITKADAINGGHFPIISGGKYPMGYYNEWNRQANTVTISRVGAYAGFVSYIQEKFYLNDKCFSVIPLRQNIAPHFLFFVLKEFEEKIKVLQSEGGVPTINTKKVGNIEIPIPPLDVQNEIVRILDTFTSHAAELQAELQARKEQYEYYRNKLFDSKIAIEKYKLSDVCIEIGDGLHGTPLYDEKGDYYFINGNNLVKGRITFNTQTKKINYNEFQRIGLKFSTNVVFLSINGTIGNVALYNNEQIALGKSVAYFVVNPLLLNVKFLYYYFLSKYAKIYFELNSTGSTIKNLGLKALRNMIIPIPSLSEQQRIVSILDKFEALVNDLTEGIPAEIAAVQEQYEYYRNKLLTFKQRA